MTRKRIQQAGAIPFTIANGRAKVLLVRARHAPHEWIFPKGHIEKDESAEEAALRELREEGGVKGEIVRFVGTSEFDSGDEPVEVKYFLARYSGSPKDDTDRECTILSPDDGLSKLAHDDAKKLLASVLPTITGEERRSSTK